MSGLRQPVHDDVEGGLGAPVGISVTFQNVSFSLPSKVKRGQTAYLLRGVSGFFTPGQLTALLGPSGSGKTTLLDVLSGRKNTGKVEGEVSFGGARPTHAFLRRYTGFVEQFDTLISSLTVEEMLMYTACLKRSVHESRQSKKEAVEALLLKLSLAACKGVRIGDPLSKGISGGEAKRTNIGIALITNPRVLFLDEPTSGLDSYTGNSVMGLLRTLANDGTSVCATIHSPSSYAFKLFDSIMMLLRGQVVYFGPTGAPALSYARASWPESKGGVEGESDAELLTGLVTGADMQGQAQALVDAYNASQLKQDNEAQLEAVLARAQTFLCTDPPAPCIKPSGSATPSATPSTTPSDASMPPPRNSQPTDMAKQLAARHATTTPWWYQLLTLLQYRTLRNYSDPAWLGPRIMDKLICTLIILTLYLGIGADFSIDNTVNLGASLFMWTTLPAFGAAAYLPSIVLERRLFIRERADGLYTVFCYLLCKALEEVVLAAAVSIVSSAAAFYAIGYQGSFATYWVVYYVTLCNGIVLAYLVAALSPSMEVANAALPAYAITLLFFAGQLITFKSMPPWWKWYSYIDFLKYAWGALMVNQFQGQTGSWTQDGATVLQYFGLDGVRVSAYIGYLSLFFFAYAAMAYLAMSYIRHDKR